MNRRALLHLLGAAAASTAVEPARRVYSFLWDNPLVRLATPLDMMALVHKTITATYDDAMFAPLSAEERLEIAEHPTVDFGAFFMPAHQTHVTMHPRFYRALCDVLGRNA